ncbi:MAG: MFS transporter [Chloroflexi bacterium]|nr:MFS transporter [Chloroflexota bacterium]
MTLWYALRGLVRRDVLIICLVIFCADLVTGILSPTFSLYAKDLGASLTLIGILSSIVGLTQLITSMPLSVQSDKSGRKIVLIVGMLSFAVATFLFAISPNAYFLIPGRVLIGLGSVSTFSIGVAYVADIVSPSERGLAYGLYATSMGIGFGVGPLIGAFIALHYGVAASYLMASGIALIGMVLGFKGLRTIRQTSNTTGIVPLKLQWRSIRNVIREPRIMAGSLANLIMSTSFSGAIINFFPMYSAQIGLSQIAINSMFSIRAFGSAAARLPTGAITHRISSRIVMGAALVLAMLAVIAMAQTETAFVLGILLLIEGVAFGTFLTSGQAYIAECSTPESRGTAVGAYSTAGSLGSTLSPVMLGVVAEVWGVQMVFRVTGVLILIGLLGIVGLDLWKLQAKPIRASNIGDGDSSLGD